jgi:hypothetical protein
MRPELSARNVAGSNSISRGSLAKLGFAEGPPVQRVANLHTQALWATLADLHRVALPENSSGRGPAFEWI